MKQPPKRAVVTFRNAIELLVDEARHAVVADLARQQLRAQHRRQCQRDEARKRHRADHRGGELAEQQPGVAGKKHDRHEHRADNGGRRDDREGDLPRPLESRDERRLAPLDAVVDVLEDDDGVVDDEADRQHQRE